MKPLKAIRKQCLFCMNGQSKEVESCPSSNCNFYYCRFGKNETKPRKSALQLIKRYCTDCSGGSAHERKNCWDEECPLYIYRNGHNPAREGQGPKKPAFLKEVSRMADLEHKNNI